MDGSVMRGKRNMHKNMHHVQSIDRQIRDKQEPVYVVYVRTCLATGEQWLGQLCCSAWEEPNGGFQRAIDSLARLQAKTDAPLGKALRHAYAAVLQSMKSVHILNAKSEEEADRERAERSWAHVMTVFPVRIVSVTSRPINQEEFERFNRSLSKP